MAATGSPSIGRRPGVALAAALLGLAACASEHPAPYDCDVDPSMRPLGSKIVPFIAWVRALPQETADHFRERGAMLAEDGRSFMQRRADEVHDTGENLRALPVALKAEFGERSEELEGYVERQGDRMREDAHCFFARAWHSLKLLE